MWMPPEGSLERWALEYVTSESLEHKLAPPSLPQAFCEAPQALVLAAPGRDPRLTCVARGAKSPGPEALKKPERRAALLHTFLHHELQAAELMCRAVLAYPDAPQAFRRGLLGICLDEVRHMGMYADHLRGLGFGFGDFPVNDWFWRRVPDTTTPLQFVALMGIGFEGGNLDHTERFADRFRAAGDEAGAALQELVSEEEIPHVAFAVHWFERWAGPLDFARWRSELPPPLSPMLMRGLPLNRRARERAGMDARFMEELEAWQPDASGS